MNHKMSFQRWLITFVASFALILFSSAGYTQNVDLDKLSVYIEKAMTDWNMPGLAVGVVKDDNVMFAKGFGVRELGKNEKVDEYTLFGVASNTKAFTATLLGILIDEGKIESFDTKVNDLLPGFKMYDPFASTEMTIRDLLTHRSGLQTFGGDHLWIGSNLNSKEILHRIRYLKPKAPFRSRYQYNNLMFMTAGLIVPAVTGISWDDFIQQKIFDPLGMDESNTRFEMTKTEKNVARPHEYRGNELEAVEYDNVNAVGSAAAINSNVLDMIKWMRMNINKGMFEGKRIISERTLREIHSRQFANYGLGWGVGTYKNRNYIRHSGGLTGMISHQFIIPEEKLGVIILSNYAEYYGPSLSSALSRYVLDRYLGEDEYDWSGQYLAARKNNRARGARLEDSTLTKKVEGTKPSLNLDSYAGTYGNSFSGNATISLRDGKLLFYYNEKHQGYLEHWNYDTFRITWMNKIFDMPDKSFISFYLDEFGKIKNFKTSFYQPIYFDRIEKKN